MVATAAKASTAIIISLTIPAPMVKMLTSADSSALLWLTYFAA
jgi:hypothetical protein